MINVGYITPHEDYEACAQLRIIQPCTWLEKKQEVKLFNLTYRQGAKQFLNYELLNQCDIVILQRHACVNFPVDQLRASKNKNLKIIFELDDDFLNLYPGHPDQDAIAKIRHILVAQSLQCDVVTTPNAGLGAWWTSSHLKPVHVIPNRMSDNYVDFGKGYSAHRVFPDFHILISGAYSHEPDFRLIENVLYTFLKDHNVTCTIWGMVKETNLTRLPNVFIRRDTQPNYSIYLSELAKYQYSVALVPLADNMFNRHKSNVKQLEYVSCGIEGIYSDIGVYHELDIYGTLVENTFDAWLDALNTKYEKSYNDYSNEYYKARNFLRDNYSSSCIADKWLALFNELMEAK